VTGTCTFAGLRATGPRSAAGAARLRAPGWRPGPAPEPGGRYALSLAHHPRLSAMRGTILPKRILYHEARHNTRRRGRPCLCR